MGTFDGVIGHAQVLALLASEVDAPAQAYLFVGPESVGKATVARRFSADLLCRGDDDGIRRVLAGVHPDLVVVEPDGKAAITVDQARLTVSHAFLTPLQAERKVFVFEEGGAMNDEAANALLKTLEEPTPSTVFIIVAESVDDLPDTVASRCRTVVFGRVGEDDVSAGLAARGVESGQADRAARISGGRPGLAIALATRPEVAEFRKVWLSIPEKLAEHPARAFQLADAVQAAAEPLLAALRERQGTETDAAGDAGRVVKDRHDREVKRATSALYVSGLEILAGFYRDVAAAQFGAPVRNMDVSAASLTRVLPTTAVANAERVLETVEALAANQRPQLAFANLFADLGAAT
jgi:DNA polymerase-3 subunit delta'